MSKDTKSEIKWMYEGPKSMVNTEEYLTGRKIDKHFETYNSDFQEAPSTIDRVINKSDKNAASASTTTLLNLETIKKEDPLVAIKVKEQQIRREILDNPLKMKRLQTIVMAEMAKKMKKFAGGRRHSDSSSSSSGSSDDEKRRKRKKPSYHDKNERKFDAVRKTSSQRVETRPNEASHRRSPDRRSFDEKSSKSEFRSNKSPKKRHDSSSSNSDDGESSSKKRKNAEYGLVYMNSKPSKSSSSVRESHHRSTVASTVNVISNDKSKHSSAATTTSVKRKLTEKEMEEKRQEMMGNAKWRDEQRRKNLETFKKLEDEERRRTADASKPVDFIRPMVAEAFSKGSVEERVKSKKHSLQRRHNAMDTNFARK